MDITREQLRRYADVICDGQAGHSIDDIAKLRDLPSDLVQAWLANFSELDAGFRA